MASSVSRPSESCIDIWRRILAERERYLDFYELIKADWQLAIEAYISHEGDPSHLIPLELSEYTQNEEEAAARKASLIALYTPKPHKLPYAILERMRREHGLLHCPSCGATGAPGTLDHYLPKAVFPELSIVLLNLVPMCSDCQGVKLSEFSSDTGGKRFFHPYFDVIRDPLIRVEFVQPYRSPSFNILTNPALDRSLAELAKLHYSGLEFEIRFRRFLETKYMHLLKQARLHRNTPQRVSFSDLLAMHLQREESEKSINAWEAIFYRSVLEDQQLLHYFEQGELPDNL